MRRLQATLRDDDTFPNADLSSWQAEVWLLILSALFLAVLHSIDPNVKTFLLPTRAEKKEKEGIPNKE